MHFPIAKSLKTNSSLFQAFKSEGTVKKKVFKKS